MPVIQYLKGVNKGKYKEVDASAMEFLDSLGEGYYKLVGDNAAAKVLDKPAPKKGTDDDNEKEKPGNVIASEVVGMNNVKTAQGDFLIIEVDSPVTITLTTTEVTKNTYKDEDTEREWDRYEIPCISEGKDTKVLLPPSVVQTMWNQIVSGNMRPIEEKHPTFIVSKHGTGKQTKWSVNLLGKH